MKSQSDHGNSSITTIPSVEIEQFRSESSINQLVIKDKSTQKSDIPPISNLPVEEILKSHLQSLDLDNCETEGDNAFFVADLGEIYRQHFRWKTSLPRVEP